MGVRLTGGDGGGPPTALFFQSHLLHPEVVGRFESLREEIPDDFDLFFLLDAAGLSDDELGDARTVAGDALVPFTFDEVAAGCGDYPHPWAEDVPDGVVPGNIDLLWLHLRRRLGPYGRYWFVEHDVAFTGDWSGFFSVLRDRGADLLGTTIHPRSTLPEFHWWSSFSAGEQTIGASLLRGFFPIVRISSDALDALDDVYRAGWSGHFEVVVPTALSRLGLEMEDIGGRGPFVAGDAGYRFYTNTPTRTTLSPGTFVYKPSRRYPGLRRNMLWHPVKHTGGRLSPYLESGREWGQKLLETIGR